LTLAAVQGAFAAQESFVPAGRASARSMALGGSEMALPGTAESLFSNPAALSQLRAPQASVGFGILDSSGEQQAYLAAALPLTGRLVAAIGGVKIHFAPDAGWGDTDTLLISLAFPLSIDGKLLAGLSGKYMHQNVP